MKKINRFYFVLTLTFLFTSCSYHQYQVYKLEQQNEFQNREGMFYFLPRTVINVEVTVEKTDQVKGPYAAYADKYLGVSGVIRENSVAYDIVDIKIKTQNEPDPDKIFFVAFPRNANKKKQLMITMKENGIIESVNMQEESEANQTQFQKLTQLQSDFDDDSQPFKMFINYNIMEKVDTLFEFIHLDTVTIEKQTFRRSVVEKDQEQRARETSEYIIKLNEHKVNLLSGYQEVNYSEQSMSLMISSLEQMISEYMSLFTGKTIARTMTYNFVFIPEPGTKSKNFFLFSIDRNKGLSDLESGNTAGNIYIELMPTLTTSKIAPIADYQYVYTKSRKGFYYNIPEKTKLLLSNGKGEAIFETNILVNQFGVVHNLPSKYNKVLFFDNSASLKKVQ